MQPGVPVVLVVEPDVFTRHRIGQRLRDHGGASVSVLEAADLYEAGRVLDRLDTDGTHLAAAVVGHQAADECAALMNQVAAAFPRAKRILLVDGADRVVPGHPAWDVCVTEEELPAAASVVAGTSGAEGVRVVGRRYGLRTYQIKDFLVRNSIPFGWYDVDETTEAAELARELGLAEPVPTTVLLEDGTVLTEPRPAELGVALGLTEAARTERCDLVIVGGGPAGLAAAVYGACEGLSVVVLEDDAPGGQAGSTSRIENYLGFPAGLSGADLAHRALVQARRFGARWLVGRTATGLEQLDDGHVVHIDGGGRIHGRAVLVATGMQWRQLDVPGAESLTNRGIYFGASTAEAAQTAGEDVYVVGAGNSAGQAALFLAQHARSVTLLVRGESLDTAPMSRYLVRYIEENESITVRTRTVIAEVFGRDRLEALLLRDNGSATTERVAAGSVYVLIGMQPCTGWLPDSVALDTHGYVLTGTAVTSPERTPMITETSLAGVFAAGDVCSGTVKRVGAAVGQGAMAIQVIAQYLRSSAADRIPAQPCGDRHATRQFDLLDADGSGSIEQDDLLAAARRLVAGFDEPSASPRAHRVLSSYQEFWDALASTADADGDQRVTRAEFETAVRLVADQTAVFMGMAEAVVGLCDTDDDGQLNQVEFHRLLGALGVSIDDAGRLFHALDTDGTGYLDSAEITEALRRFYAGAALSPAESR